MKPRTLLFLGLALSASGTAMSVPAFAAGDDGSTMPTCQKGEVYDKSSRQCVKQHSARITDENRTDYASSLAREGRYEEALRMLDTVKDQTGAEVLNYRGYAMRKLGRIDEGIFYYLKAVAADPKYALVREYPGEAYVLKGRVDLAVAQLSEIKGICGVECDPYKELQSAIRNPDHI